MFERLPRETLGTGGAPAGLTLIITYKVAKAAAELLVSSVFFLVGSAGSAKGLAYAATEIRHHATEAWSIALAERLVDASTARHVFVVAMALMADGMVTLIEGWALSRRYRWSRWLVVLTTASLLPFEIRAVIHHLTAGRAGLLAVNTMIVMYLLRHGDMLSRPTNPP